MIGGCDRLEQVLKVTVLDIKAGKVRLGFEAPVDIPVHRLEVWEQIHPVARPVNATPASTE